MFISVVIPTYNRLPILEKCLLALESQKESKSFDDFEVIVVDDGSTDETSNKIKKINDIRIITHSKNKGLSSARNSGINASQSKYIAFVDSDGKKALEHLKHNFIYIGISY